MRKIVNRRIRRQGRGGSIVADVTAVVAGNTGGEGAGSTSRASTSSWRSIRIVQRGGQEPEITEVGDG